jgi:hypothetical protein
MKYCTNCKKQVNPRKDFSIVKFFLLFGVLYLPFYLFKAKTCPSCGLKQWGKPEEAS